MFKSCRRPSSRGGATVTKADTTPSCLPQRHRDHYNRFTVVDCLRLYVTVYVIHTHSLSYTNSNLHGICESVQSTNIHMIWAADTISWSSSKSCVATASCSNIGTEIYPHRSMSAVKRANDQSTVPSTSDSGSCLTNNNTWGRNMLNTVSVLGSRQYQTSDRRPFNT